MRIANGICAAVIAVAGAATLAGCAQKLPTSTSETTCSSEDALNVTKDLLAKQVESDALAKSKETDGSYKTSPSAIRSAISLLKISIDDIRTTKSDPNSTKKFCEGTAKIVFPLNAINDADQARSIANLNSVNSLADASNVQRNADAFTFTISYDIQPTDDGKSVFAESDSIGAQMDFLAEVVSSYLIKPELQNQASAQQQAQQQQQQAEQAAQQQASQATFDQAVAENKLSRQTIDATWNSIDPAVRVQILDVEKAWIKAKIANCNVQAAAASIVPLDRQTALLNCDTAANNERQNWMKQYLPVSPQP